MPSNAGSELQQGTVNIASKSGHAHIHNQQHGHQDGSSLAVTLGSSTAANLRQNHAALAAARGTAVTIEKNGSVIKGKEPDHAAHLRFWVHSVHYCQVPARLQSYERQTACSALLQSGLEEGIFLWGGRGRRRRGRKECCKLAGRLPEAQYNRISGSMNTHGTTPAADVQSALTRAVPGDATALATCFCTCRCICPSSGSGAALTNRAAYTAGSCSY